MAKVSRKPKNEESIYERAQRQRDKGPFPEPAEDPTPEPEGIEDALGATETESTNEKVPDTPMESTSGDVDTENQHTPEKPKKTKAKSGKTDKTNKVGTKSGYKAIYFDCDRSTSSIGGKNGVNALFGNGPIPIQQGIKETRTILAKLSEKTTNNIEIEGMPEGLEIFSYGLKGDNDLIIIDSISVMANQTRQWILTHDLQTGAPLKSLKTKLDYNEYAFILDSFEKFMQILGDMEATVICTTHIEQTKDNNNIMTWLPMIEGKSKHSVMKYFDAVLYTRVIEGENEAQFMWLTESRPGYPAKIRGNIKVDPFIPQDFGLVLNKIREFEPFPKILIAGDSGTGKTTSLSTIRK